MKKEKARGREREKKNIDNCNMFFSTNIRRLNLIRQRLPLRRDTETQIDDMQEMWCGCFGCRMPNGLFPPSTQFRVFYYFIYSSFIRLHFSCTVRACMSVCVCVCVCERTQTRNKNKIVFDMGFIVKHISTRRTQTNKCVISVFYAFFAIMPVESEEREKKMAHHWETEPPKNIVSSVGFFFVSRRWKFIRKLWLDLSFFGLYIAISTYRLHRVNIPPNIHTHTAHHICHVDVFNLHIEYEKKRDWCAAQRRLREKKNWEIFIKLYQKPINFYRKWHFAIYRRAQHTDERKICVASVRECVCVFVSPLCLSCRWAGLWRFLSQFFFHFEIECGKPKLNKKNQLHDDSTPNTFSNANMNICLSQTHTLIHTNACQIHFAAWFK